MTLNLPHFPLAAAVAALCCLTTACTTSRAGTARGPAPTDAGMDPPDGQTVAPPSAPIGTTIYYYATHKAAGPPIAKALYHFDDTRVPGAYYVALTFSREFVDNTYGANSSLGYRKDKPHQFKDLVGSDHTIIGLEDGDGDLLYEIKLDYLTDDDSVTSGYTAGGIWDGDGKMIEGPEEVVLEATSSLSRNLNERGCVYLEDSPTTAQCPAWEPRVIYEVWIAEDAFGTAGFGQPVLDHVHASPSRMDNSIPVNPGEPPNGCVPLLDEPTATRCGESKLPRPE